jgi:hypothetical protein
MSAASAGSNYERRSMYAGGRSDVITAKAVSFIEKRRE